MHQNSNTHTRTHTHTITTTKKADVNGKPLVFVKFTRIEHEHLVGEGQTDDWDMDGIPIKLYPEGDRKHIGAYMRSNTLHRSGKVPGGGRTIHDRVLRLR
jgi:hypothetical protein